MYPGQQLKASDNHEVMLFPLEVLCVTQKEHYDYNEWALDFASRAKDQGLTPYYAPVSCTCSYKGTDYYCWKSNSEVHYMDNNGNDTLGYMSWMCGHDERTIVEFNVGDKLSQGDLMGYTGNAGTSAGRHLHLCSWTGTGGQGWGDKTNIHVWCAFFVNDTEIRDPLDPEGDYDWKEWSEPTPPTPTEHFGTIYGPNATVKILNIYLDVDVAKNWESYIMPAIKIIVGTQTRTWSSGSSTSDISWTDINETTNDVRIFLNDTYTDKNALAINSLKINYEVWSAESQSGSIKVTRYWDGEKWTEWEEA